MPNKIRTPWVVAVPLLLSGCAGMHLEPSTLAPATDVAAVLYLVGDAGAPRPGGEPVLEALKKAIVERTDSVERRLVFLGDNIYPSGLPPEGAEAEERSEAERRILAQIDVALETATPTIFVPGNHDWDYLSADGWGAVLRQEEFAEAAGEGLVSWLPDGGCPGPVVHDMKQPIRLVVLDTEWWLRDGDRPEHPASACQADAEEEILALLGEALRGAGERHVIVTAHHPLATGGPHGGYFTLGQHVFPLRDWRDWMWIPLPIIGSVYPLARMIGFSDQDTSGRRNRAMRAALDSTLATAPPLWFTRPATRTDSRCSTAARGRGLS